MHAGSSERQAVEEFMRAAPLWRVVRVPLGGGRDAAADGFNSLYSPQLPSRDALSHACTLLAEAGETHTAAAAVYLQASVPNPLHACAALSPPPHCPATTLLHVPCIVLPAQGTSGVVALSRRAWKSVATCGCEGSCSRGWCVEGEELPPDDAEASAAAEEKPPQSQDCAMERSDSRAERPATCQAIDGNAADRSTLGCATAAPTHATGRTAVPLASLAEDHAAHACDHDRAYHRGPVFEDVDLGVPLTDSLATVCCRNAGS